MEQSGSLRHSYFGPEFDRFVQRHDARRDEDSRIVKMQKHYYEAKQKFLRKLRKKEDDCVVASDSVLDAKLELCKSIEDTCTNLLYVLEAYEERMYCLAHEENATGKFLKEEGKQDKSRAGKMMTATGKTLCYTAQQRIQLRNPLVRLYKEVETFQYRAIADTLVTINKMEKARTEYRGALLWMKDLSAELDPDTYKQLDKFRKVQDHVRQTKQKFDKLKLDTLQKIDMLSASRCNMFSHTLLAYQNCLNMFWEKTSKAMNAISESFKGYQHYEFSMLKELTEPSKKLAQITSGNAVDTGSKAESGLDLSAIFDSDKDALIFFESEYRDEEDDKGLRQERVLNKSPKENLSKELKDLFSTNRSEAPTGSAIGGSSFDADEIHLLDDTFSNKFTFDSPNLGSAAGAASLAGFTGGPESAQSETDSDFFSSSLGDIDQMLNSLSLENTAQISNKSSNRTEPEKPQSKNPKKKEWFNLFAELDPLANPDSIGANGDPNKNC